MFILAEIAATKDRKSELVLLGTAFPVTHRHMITTYHSLIDDDSKPVDEEMLRAKSFVIGTAVVKENGVDVMVAPISVAFVSGNAGDDFAFLQITNPANYLNSYLPLCPLDRLPDRNVKESSEVKAYHAPIGQYQNNDITELVIWTEDYKRVLQYQAQGTRILVDGGLYRGSCGGPYVDHDGFVVAMHCASMHEGKNMSNVKKRKHVDRIEDLESLASSLHNIHNSVREGIVLSRIKAVVDFITAINSLAAPPINP